MTPYVCATITGLRSQLREQVAFTETSRNNKHIRDLEYGKQGSSALQVLGRIHVPSFARRLIPAFTVSIDSSNVVTR